MALDPTFVPAKYHPFIIPTLRRIYLNTDPSRSSAALRQLQEQLPALKKENEDLASKLKGRDRDIKLLMTKCESHMAAASTFAKGERDMRLENERLRRQMDRLADRYKALQDKFSEQEHQAGSSEETRPNADRGDHPQNQSRSVPRAQTKAYQTRGFLGWYTVDPDVLLLPLPYHVRVAVVTFHAKSGKGSSLIRRGGMISLSVLGMDSLVKTTARLRLSASGNIQRQAPPPRCRQHRHQHPRLRVRKPIVKPASRENG